MSAAMNLTRDGAQTLAEDAVVQTSRELIRQKRDPETFSAAYARFEFGLEHLSKAIAKNELDGTDVALLGAACISLLRETHLRRAEPKKERS